jgi:hypothetical protein
MVITAAAAASFGLLVSPDTSKDKCARFISH